MSSIVNGPLDENTEVVIKGSDVLDITITREVEHTSLAIPGTEHLGGLQAWRYTQGPEVIIRCREANLVMKPKPGETKPAEYMPVTKMKRFL